MRCGSGCGLGAAACRGLTAPSPGPSSPPSSQHPKARLSRGQGDLGLQASHIAAGGLRQSHVHLKMLKLEDRDSHSKAMLAAVSWGEAEGRENHGRLELEKPLPSSWPDGSPGNSAALCKICFRVTQAGSLATSPWGEGPASSVEEGHASRLAGTSRWLAAASSLRRPPSDHPGLVPSPPCLPTVTCPLASAEQPCSGGGGGGTASQS